MRLWHVGLIPVLPDKQLVSQWRECCAIAGKIAKTGSPNHILVNKVIDYPPIHILTYTSLVINEMHKRNFKISEKAYLDFCKNIENGIEHFNMYTYRYVPAMINDIFRDWHNDRYLKQCLYNLQEKYDCKGITKEEWSKINAIMEVKL